MLSSWIGGTRRLMLDVGQYGLLLGPVRRALVEPAASARDEPLRLLLCYYGKRCWQAGLIAGRCGNLSARLSGGDQIYITPQASNKSRLNAAAIERVSLFETTPEDRERVSVEFPMHRACYLADPGVGAVIHTHAPALTAAGIRQIDVTRILPEVGSAIGGLCRLPYARSGSQELADSVGQAVSEGAGLMILERHGAVSVGRDLAEAYDRMEFGELSARTALLATEGPPCE